MENNTTLGNKSLDEILLDTLHDIKNEKWNLNGNPNEIICLSKWGVPITRRKLVVYVIEKFIEGQTRREGLELWRECDGSVKVWLAIMMCKSVEKYAEDRTFQILHDKNSEIKSLEKQRTVLCCVDIILVIRLLVNLIIG